MQNLPLKKDYLWVRITCIHWITCDKEFIVGKIYFICSKLTFSAIQYSFLAGGGTLNPTRHFASRQDKAYACANLSFLFFYLLPLSDQNSNCNAFLSSFQFLFICCFLFPSHFLQVILTGATSTNITICSTDLQCEDKREENSSEPLPLHSSSSQVFDEFILVK